MAALGRCIPSTYDGITRNGTASRALLPPRAYMHSALVLQVMSTHLSFLGCSHLAPIAFLHRVDHCVRFIEILRVMGLQALGQHGILHASPAFNNGAVGDHLPPVFVGILLGHKRH